MVGMNPSDEFHLWLGNNVVGFVYMYYSILPLSQINCYRLLNDILVFQEF